jgi:DNA-binding NarL/FixJ family response regulator
VLRAIHSVARGEAVFGPEVASRVLTSFSSRVDVPQVPFPELSDRERQVLDLLAARHSTEAIGRRLEIRPKTVRNHISNILTKLAVIDRTEAVLRAREAGLGRD